MDGNGTYNGQQNGAAWQQQSAGNGQAYGSQPYGNQPGNGQAYGSQPYGNQSGNGQVYGSQPYGNQSGNVQSYGGQPYNGQPYSYPYPPVYQPPKKDGIGKKIGYFFLALSPAAASLILQLVLSLVYVLIAAVIEMVSYMGQHPAASQSVLTQIFYQALQEHVTGGVFFYHLLSLPIFGLWYYFGCKRPKLKQSFKNVTWKAAAIAVLGGWCSVCSVQALSELSSMSCPGLWRIMWI